MIGCITVDIEGRDMDTASRHARRIADSFIDDLDNMRRNSRNADRRAMSHFETSSSYNPAITYETPIRKAIRRSVVSSRLGSVPPTGTYTTVNDARVITPRVYTTLSSGLPPRTPSRMMSSVITTREVPSVMSNYSTYRYPETIIEPISIRSSYTPIYHQFYSGAPSGYVPSRGLYSSGSYNDLSSDRLRRINRRIDDELLEYKPLSDDYFRKMRGSLRSLNDKISTHKKLIDRYSGIDMSTANDSVADHIDLKYRELTDRMPEIEGFRIHGPSMTTSLPETNIYYKSPQTTMGYGQGLATPTGSATSELRGRIKRLLCRSKKDPHYYRYLPSHYS